MLKIRDNVDLKELKKFGFTREKLTGWCYTKDINDSITCFVNENDRHIWFGDEGICTRLAIIYDLIKADMVEKVEE